MAAQIVTNIVRSSADAYISDSKVTTTGDVRIEASNTAGIDARLNTSAKSGEQAYGFLLAFNSIGWRAAGLLFNVIDTLLGDPLTSDDAFGLEEPARTFAEARNVTIRTTGDGDLIVSSVNAAQINATVSNAASSAASALYGATGKAAGFVLASNKVSSGAEASIADATVDVKGMLDVLASDEAGIFANVKLVSSSITANDGGASIIQGVDHQLHRRRLPHLGGRAHDPLRPARTARARLRRLRVWLRRRRGLARDRRARPTRRRLGLRTVEQLPRKPAAGDRRQRDVRRGLRQRRRGRRGVPLPRRQRPRRPRRRGLRRHTRWARLGGDAGALYQYLGPDGDLDLAATDYSDGTLWKLVAGQAGSVYEYMGTEVTIDLSTEDYSDLGYWKPVPATSLVPQGINVTNSDSMAIGAVVAMNIVRSDVEATISESSVKAGGVRVRALELAVIRATTDSSRHLQRRQHLHRAGPVARGNGVIATNVIQSSAKAQIIDSVVDTTLDRR